MFSLEFLPLTKVLQGNFSENPYTKPRDSQCPFLPEITANFAPSPRLLPFGELALFANFLLNLQALVTGDLGPQQANGHNSNVSDFGNQTQ